MTVQVFPTGRLVGIWRIGYVGTRGERHQPPQSPYAYFANSRDLDMKPLLERVLALR